jgi:16S rRNA processing protein RimM
MTNSFHRFPCFTADHRPAGTSSPEDDAEGAPSDALIRVGFVFRPHGVHGELKVNPETSDPEQFETFEQVMVGPDPLSVTPYSVASVRYQQTKRGTTVILQLEEVDSRDAAETITKHSVFVDEDDLSITDDELLINDLIGLDVTTVEGDTIGTVANVLEHPAHLTVIVNRGAGREAMIPFVADFIRDVDLDQGHMIVELIEGMGE